MEKKDVTGEEISVCTGMWMRKAGTREQRARVFRHGMRFLVCA